MSGSSTHEDFKGTVYTALKKGWRLELHAYRIIRIWEGYIRGNSYYRVRTTTRFLLLCSLFHCHIESSKVSAGAGGASRVRFFFFLPAPGALFVGTVSCGMGPLGGVAALITAGAGVAEECARGTPRDSGGTLSPSLAEAEEEKDIFE